MSTLAHCWSTKEQTADLPIKIQVDVVPVTLCRLVHVSWATEGKKFLCCDSCVSIKIIFSRESKLGIRNFVFLCERASETGFVKSCSCKVTHMLCMRLWLKWYGCTMITTLKSPSSLHECDCGTERLAGYCYQATVFSVGYICRKSLTEASPWLANPKPSPYKRWSDRCRLMIQAFWFEFDGGSVSDFRCGGWMYRSCCWWVVIKHVTLMVLKSNLTFHLRCKLTQKAWLDSCIFSAGWKLITILSAFLCWSACHIWDVEPFNPERSASQLHRGWWYTVRRIKIKHFSWEHYGFSRQ